MPGNVAGNIIGKKSICWACGDEFLLDDTSLRKDKPECAKCDTDNVANQLEEYFKIKGV